MTLQVREAMKVVASKMFLDPGKVYAPYLPTRAIFLSPHHRLDHYRLAQDVRLLRPHVPLNASSSFGAGAR